MYLVEQTGETIINSILIVLNIEPHPKILDEAMKYQDTAFWKEVINYEIDSKMASKAWKLVGLPLGSKPIGCKRIFKKKIKIDGTIDKNKGR